MPSKRTVIFIDDNAYLLEGYRHTAKHIRGRVVNGGWTMYIVKESELCWVAFSAGSRSQCTDANEITRFNPAVADFIEVPETVLGDHYLIVNWARGQRRST